MDPRSFRHIVSMVRARCAQGLQTFCFDLHPGHRVQSVPVGDDVLILQNGTVVGSDDLISPEDLIPA